jgi:hypothetical protein
MGVTLVVVVGSEEPCRRHTQSVSLDAGVEAWSWRSWSGDDTPGQRGPICHGSHSGDSATPSSDDKTCAKAESPSIFIIIFLPGACTNYGSHLRLCVRVNIIIIHLKFDDAMIL